MALRYKAHEQLRYHSGLPRSDKFRVGITPDFYTQAKGYFEDVIEETFGGVPGLGYICGILRKYSNALDPVSSGVVALYVRHG